MDKKYFGVMLDMSRNAVMKPEQVKKFMKTISAFGYNMVQLYVEDTYEVDGEPYFGYMRGRYTKEDIKGIVSYCETIGVEVVPCIQTLAHLNQIFRWSVYQGVNDVADILLVENDRTYELIENMFKTLRECYKTNYVHIGMDEAHMLGLGKYLEQHGYQKRFDILLKHLQKVVEIAKKYGFKPMMWSDMFFRLANNGEYYSSGKTIPQEVKDMTPQDIGLVYWDYYHKNQAEYDAMIKSHLSFNDNEVWFAGGAWTWAGFAPKNRYSLQTMKPAMASCRKFGLDKIFITMWGDNGKECSFYSMLPSLFAIRKFYEGETKMSKIKAEFEQVTGEKFDAMMALDLPNDIGKKWDTNHNVCKYALYSDPFNGFLESTFPVACASEYKTFARRLAKYAKTSNYAYLFDYMSKLCDALSVKFDLGIRTRTAYQAGDKTALTALIADYKKAEKKVETFYVAFKKVWFEENHPSGFDVQDQRLGGLLFRLRSCRERLSDYLTGKITSIPELEEKLLGYFNEEEFTHEPIHFNTWTGNVTANIM